MFSPETWKNRVVPGEVIYHDALSIVPYLARYTLARREELCGLDVDDVLDESGIPYIFVRPNEHRTLKNPQSTRRIPLIGEVVRLGFLRYRAEIKSLVLTFWAMVETTSRKSVIPVPPN